MLEANIKGLDRTHLNLCWYEGHITDDDKICDKIAKILNVPTEYDLVCILPVGIAENEIIAPKKKDFSERAWFNAFKCKE